MTTDFKAPRVNTAGSITPILLVGGLGQGKETNFIKLLSSDCGDVSPVVLRPDLFGATLQDISNPLNDWSITGQIISDIESSVKGNEKIIAVFEGVDDCHPMVVLDLIEKLNSKTASKITYVLSCQKIPTAIENSPGVKDQLQIIQFELPPVQPVLQVHELEESPFHYYGDQANFLAKYPQQINDPRDAHLLTSLAELMKAVEGIEGGILGQEAHDRGMDGSVIQALAAFSRAHKGSENALADGISRAVIKELLACPVVPKFIEVNPQQKQPAPDSPTLG